MEEFIKPHIEAIIASISTFILVTIPRFIKWKRRNQVNDTKFIVDFLKSQVEGLTVKVEELTDDLNEVNSKNIELVKSIRILQYQITVTETAHLNSPFPMWIKDLNGIMISLNKSYEKHFLLPQGFTSSDYIGYKDEKIWGKELSEVFQKNDDAALEDSIWQGNEVGGDYKNLLKKWHFIKYKRVVEGITIGIAGIAIPKSNSTLKIY